MEQQQQQKVDAEVMRATRKAQKRAKVHLLTQEYTTTETIGNDGLPMIQK